MKLYGSLQNRLEEGKQIGELYVGMGATEMLYSDRHAYEVVEVIDQKHVIVRRCKAKRIDHNGMSECQEYEYELEPYEEHENWFGEICNNNVKLVLTKKGWRERYDNRKLGNHFLLGYKEEYYDYSF